jgi:RNA polymerase sigma-70 factor, ECF subfamily
MREATSHQAQSDRSIDQGGRAGAVRDSEMVRRAVVRAQQGDQEGLHFLYTRYAPDVLRYVRSFVHDHHEAEDITQNIFIKLMSVIGKYEAREVPFTAWILRVSRNAALDHMRAKWAIPSEGIHLQSDERSQLGHERGNDLREALETLPGEQRDVLILRHIVGLTPMEIATVLGKTESSIHGLHHRGRRSLKMALQDRGAGPVVARPASTL